MSNRLNSGIWVENVFVLIQRIALKILTGKTKISIDLLKKEADCSSRKRCNRVLTIDVGTASC